MPIFFVVGIRPDKFLTDDLKQTVEKIPELELSRNDVTVVPCDSREDFFTSSDAAVFVDGLFKKEKRTKAVKDELAQEILKVLKNNLGGFTSSNVDVVEVFVREFDPEKEGFALWEKDE